MANTMLTPIIIARASILHMRATGKKNLNCEISLKAAMRDLDTLCRCHFAKDKKFRNVSISSGDMHYYTEELDDLSAKVFTTNRGYKLVVAPI